MTVCGHESRNCPRPNGPPQKKILLIRWKSIGDVVFTLPALRCLRSNFSDSHITYLTSPEFESLVTTFAVADEVLTVDRARLRRFFGGGLQELLKLWRVLSRTHFDIVVDFQSYGETAWLSWLTRAPQRWGLVSRPSRAWAYTLAVPRDEKAHPVDAQLQVLARCGLDTSRPDNRLDLPAREQETAEKLFQQFGLRPDAPTVFVQPFTSSPQKDWPLDKWLALGRSLRASGIHVLFGGGPSERGRLGPATAENFPVAAGADLLTSCALAARCGLVIGADTGLLHLANSAGCRVLLLKRLEAKECPYAHPDWVLTPSQSRLPVSEIEVEKVLIQARQTLESVHSQAAG